MAEWLAMDGYAGFVWTAWGLTVAVIGALVTWAWRARSRANARLAQLEAELNTLEPPR